ncbi:arginase family protein [Desulforamulus ruminis]
MSSFLQQSPLYPEAANIHEQNITVLKTEDIEAKIDDVMNVIQSKGSQNIYVHIDLDALDPVAFPHVPVPPPGGLTVTTLSTLLKELHEKLNIIGLCLVEYQPSEKKTIKILEEIIHMGIML